MSAFWAVFLLCSLLNPSQGLGIMSSVGKVDVDGKCTEETGFIFFFFFFFETSSAFLSLDHAQKIRNCPDPFSSSGNAGNLHL